jgi:hypothetical protein
VYIGYISKEPRGGVELGAGNPSGKSCESWMRATLRTLHGPSLKYNNFPSPLSLLDRMGRQLPIHPPPPTDVFFERNPVHKTELTCPTHFDPNDGGSIYSEACATGGRSVGIVR